MPDNNRSASYLLHPDIRSENEDLIRLAIYGQVSFNTLQEHVPKPNPSPNPIPTHHTSSTYLTPPTVPCIFVKDTLPPFTVKQYAV